MCAYVHIHDAGGCVKTHEIRLSIDVSIGLVLIDLRNDARPGVNANELDGMVCSTRAVSMH